MTPCRAVRSRCRRHRERRYRGSRSLTRSRSCTSSRVVQPSSWRHSARIHRRQWRRAVSPENSTQHCRNRRHAPQCRSRRKCHSGPIPQWMLHPRISRHQRSSVRGRCPAALDGASHHSRRLHRQADPYHRLSAQRPPQSRRISSRSRCRHRSPRCRRPRPARYRQSSVRHRQPTQRRDAFLYACAYGRNSVVDFLLEKGADLTAHRADGQTALHWAIIGGQLETVKLLLRHNPPLEQPNIYGGTALGQAIWSSEQNRDPSPYLKIIDILIEAGAMYDMLQRGPPCGRSLAPVTTAHRNKLAKSLTNTSESIAWMVVPSTWLLESLSRRAKPARAGQAEACPTWDHRCAQ